MKPKLILCLALLAFNLPMALRADPTATNILENLFATKTLVLASRPKIIIPSPQPQTSSDSTIFVHADIIARKMIDEFSFKAQLSRPGHPLIALRVAANKDHASVVIQTPDGQPYLLMADNMCVICDQANPGELAYFDGGTVQWGLFQSQDRTNADFQMSFIPTNVPPTVVLDVRFIIQGCIAKMTSLAYSTTTNENKIKFSSSRGFVEITLAKDNPNDPFGVAEVKIQNGDVIFDFTDFKVGTLSRSDLFRFTKGDLQELGVPLHALVANDLNQLNPYIPQGFPNSEREKAAAKKLQSLIASHLGE